MYLHFLIAFSFFVVYNAKSQASIPPGVAQLGNEATAAGGGVKGAERVAAVDS